MRAVCFVNRLEFELSGNVFPNAMTLGDVDNDGHHELILGSTDGNLSIFKAEKKWQTINGLGMITAVCVGDLFNCGKNALVLVCGDGWCQIFFAGLTKSDGTIRKLALVHVQRIPANTKVALIRDIDGDGCNELVLGLTDRVVRSYRWIVQNADMSNPENGKLLCLNKWECTNQIGTVTLHHYGEDGAPCLLVAQPGGTYMKISCLIRESEDAANIDSEDLLTSSLVDYHPLASSHMRNPNVSTEIVGDIEPPEVAKKSPKTKRYAVATLDGTLMLVEDEEILWSIQVDHQLFSLTKLSLTGGNGGGDNIVACSWDGQTYILDQEKQSVRFQLDEHVCGFCSGYYSITLDHPPSPCLVYTTFTNKIYVYYDVKIPGMVMKSCVPYGNIGLKLDNKQRRELTEWILYGKKK
ncbi:KICSTOR complex protein ITFG2-like [Schistocerca cancellata]|uniref:KICSTOR complex protein ITFG2-like n=1 Tax=Schistocerca cancellata TaxID=274614 RepID=UPI0021193BCC|nr:KICSTOR complex protein ITFG2-like [Schistocerca cancellata]